MVTREEAIAELERRRAAPTFTQSQAQEEIQRRQADRPIPTAPVEDTPLTTLEAAGRGIAQGATLGFSDELQAAIAAGTAKAFGGEATAEKSIEELFREGQKQIRGRERAVAETAPITATVSEIAGGVATGGAGLARAASLGGLKGAAAVVGTAGALGTVAGTGFSEAKEADKIIEDAQRAGMVSAATAGILRGVTRVGAPLVQKTLNSIMKSKNPNKFTQAEEFVRAKIADGTAPELLREIRRAEAAGIAAPIAGVTQAPGLQRISSAVAQNVKTEDIAKLGVDKLSNTLARAERNVLNKVAKEVTTAQEGAEVFGQSIRSLKNAAIEARRLKAGPLYNSVVKQKNRLGEGVVRGLRSFKTKTGTTNPVIGQTIDDLRKTGQFIDLPDNSMPVLDATFKKLGAMKRASGIDDFERGLISDAQNKLRKAIAQKFPVYEKAVRTFSDESAVLNELSKKKNPLASLLNADDPDAVRSVTKIFNQQPELIARNRAFAKANNLEAAFDAGAKANILEKVERSVNAGGKFSSVFKAPKARQQLVASVGKQNANAFQEVMKAMDNFQGFKRGLQGSQTQPLQAAERQIAGAAQTGRGRLIGGAVRTLGKAKDFVVRTDKTIEDIANASEDPRFRQELANILFDRKTGKKFLEKIANPKTRNEGVGGLFSTALDRVRELEPALQKGLTAETVATGIDPIETITNGDLAPRVVREGERVR